MEHAVLGKHVGLSCVEASLRYTGQGACVVRCDGKEQFAADILGISLFKETDSGSYVVVEGEDMQWFGEYMSCHTNHEIHIPIAGSLRGHLQGITEFRRKQAGCQVWWHLPSLHMGLNIQGTPSHWYHKYWPRWQNKLQKLGLSGVHMRRALQTKHSKLDQNHKLELAIPERVLEAYSLSTRALLALLPSWAAPVKHVKSDDTKSRAFEQFFDALMRQWGHPLQDTTWHIAMPCTGSRDETETKTQSIQLRVKSDGHVTCIGTEKFSDVEAVRCLQQFDPLDLTLKSILMSWGAAGIHARSCFMELVAKVSGILEARILACGHKEVVGDPAAETAGTPAGKTKRKRTRQTLKNSAREALVTNQRRACLKYWFCGRRIFHLVMHLALACDFSRVSRRGCGVGFVGDQENNGMWAPPQVALWKQSHVSAKINHQNSTRGICKKGFVNLQTAVVNFTICVCKFIFFCKFTNGRFVNTNLLTLS